MANAFFEWFFGKKTEKGGAGSGNFGHAGRPGRVGGSAPQGVDYGSASPQERAEIDLMDTGARAGGFSYNPGRDCPNSGYMVSLPRNMGHERVVHISKLTKNHILAYMRERRRLLKDKRLFIGGWFDEKTGNVYLDVSIHYPKGSRRQAMAYADSGKQEAIFNLNTYESEYVSEYDFSREDTE